MATVSDHKTFDCPVCFERYISPRVLPCQHTLCEKCLDAHVTSQAVSGTECLCPLCNSPIVPPDPELSEDKWAKAFPLDSLICSLMEAADCEPCKSGGENTTADVWCTDCRERMCHSCDKLHRRYKQFKQHTQIPISKIGLQSNFHLDQNCDIIYDRTSEQKQRSTPDYPGIISDNKEIKKELESSNVLGDIEGAMKSVDIVQVSTKPCTSTSAVLQSTDGIIRQVNSGTNISTDMCAAQVKKRDLMTSPVSFVKDLTTDKLGKGTWITCGTSCSDGRLLMADRGNNRLLQLDADYNVVSQYKIDGYPTDVAIGNNDNEIYIAVNKQYIYKCTLDTVLTIVSRIRAPRDTVSITVTGDNIIVGTKTAVVILTQDGSVVQSIQRSGNITTYVTTSQSQQTICHTDEDDVVCRTLDGRELFRYQDEKLRDPFGICVDRQDNLYTCGFDSRNVHQVSLDRHSGRIIMDKFHSISRPYSVMFHPQRDEFIVTSRGENTVFEVYRFV